METEALCERLERLQQNNVHDLHSICAHKWRHVFSPQVLTVLNQVGWFTQHVFG